MKFGVFIPCDALLSWEQDAQNCMSYSKTSIILAMDGSFPSKALPIFQFMSFLEALKTTKTPDILIFK